VSKQKKKEGINSDATMVVFIGEMLSILLSVLIGECFA